MGVLHGNYGQRVPHSKRLCLENILSMLVAILAQVMSISASFFSSVLSLACVSWWAVIGPRTPVCHCDCGEHGSEALNILRSQLDRCGPESLAARPCPPCPSARAAASVLAGFALGTVLTIGLAGFALGFFLGVLSTCYYFVHWRQR